MKFLVIGKLKDVALTLPPAAAIPMFEASIAAMKQQKKEGRIADEYYSPGTGQIILILNYDNADQWQKDQSMLPILQYMDYEAYPLSNYDQYVNSALENMKAAAKMMPGAPR